MSEDHKRPHPRASTAEEHVDSLRSNGFSTNLLGFGIAVLFASAAFFSGIQVGSSFGEDTELGAGIFSAFFASSATAPDGEADLENFWRVWNLLEEKYASATSTDQVSVEDRVFGATRGLVASYDDPYTAFLPPEDAEQFSEDISGNFGGVGMEIGLRDGVVTVIAPLADTPAERAGILAGDVIVSIDDVDTREMNVNEAVRRIRGEEGTDVILELYRAGAESLVTATVTRATIEIPTIATVDGGDVFTIRLFNFNATAQQQMLDAIREFKRSDADSLVLDLRGNPGGYLQGAVTIASFFLPAGEVVVRERYGDDRPEDVYRSRGGVVHEFDPDSMVVLINRGSASASEILAGALKEHGVATVLGEPTFGKGSVQELVPLPDGSSVKITIARWYTPEGVSFSRNGLDPDYTVTRTAEQIMSGEDPQQEAAEAWLRGDRSLAETAAESASRDPFAQNQ